jgi:hypothetical protein
MPTGFFKYKAIREAEMINSSDNVLSVISHMFNGKLTYFLTYNGINIPDINMANFIGINISEYIYYLTKNFNANYSNYFNCIFFDNEEDANKTIESLDGIRIMSKLRGTV